MNAHVTDHPTMHVVPSSGPAAPVSAEERRLITEIRDRVADQLSAWESDRGRDGQVTSDGDRREYAKVLIKRDLELRSKQLLAGGRATIDATLRERLGREVLARLTGAGSLQTLLERTDWTDIHGHGTEVWIVHTNGRKSYFGHIAETPREVEDLIRLLAGREGRNAHLFNASNPLLSMTLPGGERLSAAIGVVDTGVEFTLRRNSIASVTLRDLVERGTLTPTAAEFMRAVVHARINWVVSGGTGSGKTTFVRAATTEFGEDERIITIEDAAELRLRSDRLPDVTSFEARPANLEGVGEITMADLARHALRFSSTRVIIGEVRGAEAASWVSACTQGNDGSCCTVHAESSEGAPRRLRWYLAQGTTGMSTATLTDAVAQAVSVIVHLQQFADGTRRVTSVREITGCDADTFLTQEIFRFTDDGVLEPTGAISEGLRLRLGAVGFDARRLAHQSIGSGPLTNGVRR